MHEPVNLDDVMALGEMDPGGMLAAIEDFPRQCAEALGIGRDAPELPAAEGISRVAFVGMGGSAIGGDILRALLEDVVGMPMSVHRSYRLPSLLGPDTLAVFVSYSGNTEETLSALDDAVYLGCKVLVLTTGGKLLERARANRFPALLVPGGLQPRAALGYLSLTAAAAMERMGLIQGFTRVAHETAEALRGKGEQWGRLSPLERNFAKQLAVRLRGKVPVIYGVEGILSVAAYRWKCQFNENSKVPAFCHALPEMNHNEIVGWHALDDHARRVEAIFLAEEDDASRVAKRVEITADLLREKVGGVTVLRVGGGTRTERLFSAIHLGDFVSAYLAVLNGVDPTPVEVITLLKERMAAEG
ncbi:MAG: bifunctional phosphoglucose/phosphomannose isomerase [Actinobacteria bacterium]|nr:bifunctional phosphoglucose/phosphomannose isomerase [Actinomycetota bacterium]MDI6831093.1 bifunctional phosphoglucose/phosphomannose isomerase [Actinomycetota bacterium]